ncbi:MAG: DNA alkylation repair protein [Odoribacter sp.]
MGAIQIISDLQAQGNPEKAIHLAHFFKTGKGEYGEGDLFLGVTVPEQRKIARQHQDTPLSVLEELMASPYHEIRLTALLILVDQFNAHKDDAFRRVCVDFYVAHSNQINNWDLVDLSCYKLLGEWLSDKDRRLLYDWAKSDHLWQQRIAIVTCMCFVRKRDFQDCLSISDLLIHHPHDLIHKAVGWLLRETGKKDKQVLTAFLSTRYRTMPRTMLRYAIERFPEEERKRYLNSEI